jgi:hypothetical protein
MVKVLHRAGIEVILDVVFNHTAEGNHDGPTLSFRGLDNTTSNGPRSSERQRHVRRDQVELWRNRSAFHSKDRRLRELDNHRSASLSNRVHDCLFFQTATLGYRFNLFGLFGCNDGWRSSPSADRSDGNRMFSGQLNFLLFMTDHEALAFTQ